MHFKRQNIHVLSIKVTHRKVVFGEKRKTEVIKNNNKTNKSAIIEMAIILLKTSKEVIS